MNRKRFVIAGVLAMMLLLVGVAYASIPGPDGVIHGCYRNGNPNPGSVIVIDHAASCPSGYTPLSWPSLSYAFPTTKFQEIQTGPVARTDDDGDGLIAWSSAPCQPGWRPINGYYRYFAEGGQDVRLVRHISSYRDDQRWIVTFSFDASIPASGSVDVFIVCARP